MGITAQMFLWLLLPLAVNGLMIFAWAIAISTRRPVAHLNVSEPEPMRWVVLSVDNTDPNQIRAHQRLLSAPKLDHDSA